MTETEFAVRVFASRPGGFDRVYLDTQVLLSHNWPTVGEKFRRFLLTASLMGVEVVIPEPVAAEHESHWMRDRMEECEKAISAHGTLLRHARDLTLDIKLSVPDEARWRDAYRDAVEKLIKEHGIRSIPYPNVTATRLFSDAVARVEPFCQKKDGVVGLQDMIILTSVVEDIESSPTRKGAFISQDQLLSCVSKHSSRLHYYHSTDSLMKHFNEQYKVAHRREYEEWFAQEMADLEAALVGRELEIRNFLLSAVEPDALAVVWLRRNNSLLQRIENLDGVAVNWCEPVLAPSDTGGQPCQLRVTVDYEVSVRSFSNSYEVLLADRDPAVVRALIGNNYVPHVIPRASFEISIDAAYRRIGDNFQWRFDAATVIDQKRVEVQMA